MDANQSARARSAVSIEGGFLHKSTSGGHQEMAGGVKSSDRNDAADLLFRSQGEDVYDRPPRTGSTQLGDVVHLEPVTPPRRGEAEQVGFGGSNEEMLDEIVFP